MIATNWPKVGDLEEVFVAAWSVPMCFVSTRKRYGHNGMETYEAVEMSSTWLERATNRSKKSCVPPLYISSCIVPLRLNVLRLRIMRAR